MKRRLSEEGDKKGEVEWSVGDRGGGQDMADVRKKVLRSKSSTRKQAENVQIESSVARAFLINVSTHLFQCFKHNSTTHMNVHYFK